MYIKQVHDATICWLQALGIKCKKNITRHFKSKNTINRELFLEKYVFYKPYNEIKFYALACYDLLHKSIKKEIKINDDGVNKVEIIEI